MVEKAKNATTRKVTPKNSWIYNRRAFQDETPEEDKYGEIRNVYTMKKEFSSPSGKNIHNTCKELNVNLKHLEMSYQLLNGRIIDGFQVTDLIDRYGFNYAPQFNRAQVAERYGKTVQQLEVAVMKLKGILANEDPLKAYVKHQKEYEDLLLKERRDSIVDGE